MAMAVLYGGAFAQWEDGRATFYGDIHGGETMCK